MQIFRFDEEVSIPISHFGSHFRIGPLTGHDSRVRVQVMHLPPGGLIGRQVTAGQQFFVVVAGYGWVSGGEGVRREIKPGYAALWAAGEDHDAYSVGGLTAICIEGEFDVWASAVTREIVDVDSDPEGPS